VEELEEGLRRFAELVSRELGKEVADLPGAGAAGGLGAGLVTFCNAELEPGADVILEAIGLRDIAVGAGLLVTGEGQLDSQTAFGKGPSAVARLGRALGIPVVAVVGSMVRAREEVEALGLEVAWSCATGPETLQEAMEPENTRRRLRLAGYSLMRTLQLGGKLRE
jgi:glycerate kinase